MLILLLVVMEMMMVVVTVMLLVVVQMGKFDHDCDVDIGLWNQADPELYPSQSETYKLFNL